LDINSTGYKHSKKLFVAAAGTQTAALCVAGYGVNATAVTEKYDGSTWTAGGSFKHSILS
jgi:hypothetical protein